MTGWLDFWNRPHRIYVNDRHQQVHYAKVADDIVSVLPRSGAVVLDFGCGKALAAERVAARCRQVWLCELAPALREPLARRHAGHPTIRVIGADGLDALPPGSVDLVVVNSVLQYLTRDELEAWLGVWSAKLAPEGVLVLADVVPPHPSLVQEVAALLALARRERFLLAALAGLVSLSLGEYRRLRRELGLTRYAEAELGALLARAGLAGRRLPRNFGYNPTRMTFLARRSGGLGPEGPEPVRGEVPDHDRSRGHDLGHQVVQT